MATIIITGNINIPNYFFTIEGNSYIGTYTVSSDPFALVGVTEDSGAIPLYFRNYLLQSDHVKLTELELLSKKFQNTKHKMEKIVKFTNSK
tara:strand:- start:4553 stop:4825 length:273 start_codon:yes stop_codon:yes gene_type:complete